MASSKREASPPPQTVTTYIADMLVQLAEMADENGQGGLARDIRLAAIQAGANAGDTAQRQTRGPEP
jgi:hypothetical protein